MKKTITRPCPKCLPDANGDFDYDHEADGCRVYLCRNCGLEHRAKILGRRAAGGKKQTRVVEHIKEIVEAGGHYEMVERTEDGSGTRSFGLMPKRWFDQVGAVYVGPLGSITVWHSKDGEAKGRKAWIFLRVCFG